MIYVTENGVPEKKYCTDLCDAWRMQYYKDYINEMLKGDPTFVFEAVSLAQTESDCVCVWTFSS